MRNEAHRRLLLCCAAVIGVLPAVLPAANCNPTFISPAICKPAHAVPPSFPSGGDCAVNGSGVCAPTAGTRCVARYGTAVAGECKIKIDEAHPTGCTLDAGVTVVDVPRYLASCSSASGTCQCEFTLDTQTTPAQVQVCDCTEQPL